MILEPLFTFAIIIVAVGIFAMGVQVIVNYYTGDPDATGSNIAAWREEQRRGEGDDRL